MARKRFSTGFQLNQAKPSVMGTAQMKIKPGRLKAGRFTEVNEVGADLPFFVNLVTFC
jgi:hypothetical protein